MTANYSLPKRLKAARIAAGFKTAKSFVKKHNIPPATYSQHEVGSRKPSDEAIRKYCQYFGVNFEWLKNGTGISCSRTENTEKADAIDAELLNPRELSPPALNEELLTKILEEVLETSKKSKTPTSKIAKVSIGIYKDIMAIETDKTMQMKMVKSAVMAYERFALKSHNN